MKLERAGFAPGGGGRARVEIVPAKLKPLELNERGPVRRTLAGATIAGLPRDIAERELKLAGRLLDLKGNELAVEELPHDQGPGNLVTIEVEAAEVMTVFTSFGGKGIRAEEVARDACRQAKRYLERDV